MDAFTRRFDRRRLMRRAETFTVRWGAPGIFFTRWLVTGLGPWVNVTSGVAGYPWLRFLVWDVLGEGVWVATYVTLGLLFSNRIADLAELLGSLSWLLLGLVLTIASGWELLRHLRISARHPRLRARFRRSDS